MSKPENLNQLKRKFEENVDYTLKENKKKLYPNKSVIEKSE